MYLLATLEAVGIALVFVGISFTFFLSVMAYSLVSTKEDSIRAFLIVVVFFMILSGLPIVTILLKPLTLICFDLSKGWANAVGWIFHCLVVCIGAVGGLMKRHDVI